MRGTRWKVVLHEVLASFHREAKITLTRLVSPNCWVFVVGCYNSGTELLTRMLGAQAEISALPEEGQFLTDQLPADYELGLPRMWVLREDLFRLTEDDAGPDVIRLKKEWLMRLDSRRPIFLEKSPPNSARTRWFQEHFENAHFIAIVRNGYAVAEGIRRKAEPFHLYGGWPIQLCARQWRRSNELLLEDAPALRQLIWIHYEDLVAHPARELARISTFLGLRAETLALDRDQAWAVHEKNEPIRNMNQESIARLGAADIDSITKEASGMLTHFHYPILRAPPLLSLTPNLHELDKVQDVTD